MTNDQMREAFEAWFTNDGEWPQAVERNAAGQYLLTTAATAWDAWQAGVAAGMERAAAIVEAEAKAAHSTASWESHSRLRRCADAIRAEIQKEGI